jgi:hypothetical protein
MRKWSHVISNTTYAQFLEALSLLGIPTQQAAAAVCGDDLGKPTSLKLLAHQLLAAVNVSAARRIFGNSRAIKWNNADQVWYIDTTAGNFKAHFISLAPGASARCLQTAVPQIPLEHALSVDTLKTYFTDAAAGAGISHVTVFGSAHSGVLIVDALIRCGVSVSLVYNTPIPFYYAADGAYDGVKQETATIARAIEADGMGGRVDLISYGDSLKLHQALLMSKWTVCACGFETTDMPQIHVNDSELGSPARIPYNPATGQIATRMYGWGIAFPSVTVIDGRTYTDVSIPSFAAHILRQADDLRAALLYSA